MNNLITSGRPRMIPMIKISALSLFLAVSTTTYAAWDELGSSEFMTVMIDKASIKKTGDKEIVRLRPW
ncbi:MAG: hypothetical protein NT110_04670 [Burkholderiales bacterium]|nr:hypothetical protein [Burkholderiales bacterium]